MANSPLSKHDNWLQNAWLHESTWRKENELNFDYYYGDQWTAQEMADLKANSQPICTLNYVRPLIDMILAMEAERKLDVRVVGREDSDDDIANLLTHLMKQISDESMEDFKMSNAFRDMIIGGRGVISIEPDEDDQGKPTIISKHIPWEEVYVDPYYREPDASDARYIIRTLWLDRDIAIKKWGEDKVNLILHSETNGFDDFEGIEANAELNASGRLNYFDSKYDRVLIAECQYKDSSGKIRYVQFSGSVYLYGEEDDTDDNNEPPFETNGFWLIPFTAFRDRAGLPRGIVHMIRSMQDMLNKKTRSLCGI